MKYWLAIFLLLTAGTLSAIDFGGSIENDTKFELGGGALLEQENRVSLWVQFDFSDYLAFNAQASYIFTIDDPLLYDIDAFALQGEFPVLGESPFMIKFNLGRFPLTDFTGFVLDHLVDGLEFVYSNSFMDVRLAGGYTGFLFKKTSSVVMTKADSDDIGNDDVFFAAPRVIALAELDFPEIFGRQNITLTALAQFDLRSGADLIAKGETTEDLSKGGRLTSQYFGLGIGGTIVPSLYYSTFAYMEIGSTLSYIDGEYTYASLMAFAAGARVQWFLRDVVASMFGWEALFATGDNDTNMLLEGNSKGGANMFIPITKSELGAAFAPQLPNIFLVSMEYSMKPFDALKNSTWNNLQTALKATAYFRASTGLISEDGVDPGSDSLFLGTEAALAAKYRPFSDLGMTLTAAAFFPFTTDSIGAFAEGTPITLIIRFELSLSF